jgi:hypothetical protein
MPPMLQCYRCHSRIGCGDHQHGGCKVPFQVGFGEAKPPRIILFLVVVVRPGALWASHHNHQKKECTRGCALALPTLQRPCEHQHLGWRVALPPPHPHRRVRPGI